MFKKIIHFPLTRIIVGIVVIVALIALAEQFRNNYVANLSIPDDAKNGIIGIIEITLVLLGYIFLYSWYEKRKIKELSLSSFCKNASAGFIIGFLLQTLIVLVLYSFNSYAVTHINPVSFLIPGFIMALVAGFVAEILIRGIFFRIAEEKFGTVIAIILCTLLFAIVHAASKDTTTLSVITTTIQAGILVPASYVYARNLWLPIFLHFAWDFSEPAIYGSINPVLVFKKVYWKVK